MKKLIIFDLDGTLALSKTVIDPEMAKLISELLQVAKVSVISGADWHQFQTQVIEHLPNGKALNNLSILPTCGTKYYQHKNGWKKRYSEDLTAAQKEIIINELNKAILQTGTYSDKTWGAQIEDRGSQITFSALGQEAPLNQKKAWDPDFSKRRKIKEILDCTLHNFSVHLGGTTSIDITKKGIDKAYGIYKLHEVLKININEMIFIGDALMIDGNDYPARKTGVACIQVRDPEETKRLIEVIITCLDGSFA